MREQNTEYILSLSYGKDSLACLGAIQHLGWPLDRIVTADVWATDTIPAEYPPVVAFKAHVDAYILEHYGIAVEHYCATRVDGVEKEKVTYNDGFYHVLQSGNNAGTIKGFPMQRGPWCQKLKLEALKQAEKMTYEKLFYHIRESGNRKGEICGFPFIGYPECQKSSKSRSDPQDGESDHGGRREISAIPRHRRRRAGSDRYTYRERGHKAPARRARMGGGSVWTMVQIQRPAISDLRKRRPRRVLVLPQPRSRPTEKPAENVPRPVGAASQMGY